MFIARNNSSIIKPMNTIASNVIFIGNYQYWEFLILLI